MLRLVKPNKRAIVFNILGEVAKITVTCMLTDLVLKQCSTP